MVDKTGSTETQSSKDHAGKPSKQTGSVSPVEEGKKRLEKVQAELKRRGVVDVKFAWHPDLHKLKPEHVCGEVASFLESYLEGKVKALHTIDGSNEQPHDIDVFCNWIEDFAERGTGHFVSEGACRDFIRQVKRYVELEGYIGSLPNAEQDGKDG